MAKRNKLNENLEKGEKLISMSAKSAKKLNDELKGSAGAVQGLLNVLMGISDELENNTKEMGYFEEGAKKGSNIFDKLGDKIGKMADKLDKSGTISKLLSKDFKDVAKFSHVASAGNAAMAATLVQGVIELDKMMTSYNKNFGLSDKSAKAVHNRVSLIARESGRTSITFKDIHKTLDEIRNSTGLLGTGLRNDVLEEASELQKLLGLSGVQMTNLAFNAQVTGQDMEEQSLSMARGVISAEEMVGANLDANAAFKTAAGLTGMIRANLGRNYEEIVRIVGKAQALGLTMQDLAGISANLLNFQSSIEAELTAELFIGRQLNLEKARLYALTGDYEKLQSEIVGQLGSEYEFLQMNVLQKQKFAAAMGMSVDGLSNLIMKQADLDSLMGKAEARGDRELLRQLKEQDLAAKFQDLVTKIQMTFVDIADGPLGGIATFLSSAAQNAGFLYSMLGLIAVIKIAGLVQSVIALGTAMKAAGMASAVTKAMMNPKAALLGVLAAGAIVAIASAVFRKGDQSAQDSQMKVKSYANLGDEEMVTVDKGGAMFHAGETVVREDNFGKLTDAIHILTEETRRNRPARLPAKHEVITSFR